MISGLVGERPISSTRSSRRASSRMIGLPGGEVAINTTGSSAMASGGCGDVLTGLLAARLAQGDEPAFAARLAVHLHGLAGDLAVAAGFAPAVPAGVLAEHLPQAYEKLRQA